MKLIKNTLYTCAFLYVCIGAFLFGMQRSFLYFPPHSKVPLAEVEAAGVFRELAFKTEDGLDLKAWYAPATRKRMTIIYFHGNADCLSSAIQVAEPYVGEGYGFLLVEYRGYSGLSGRPSENGLYADGRAAVHKLFDLGAQPDSFVMMGHSLGSGVATQMAVEYHAPALVLVAPFLSTVQVAQKRYPIFPVDLLMLDRFDNQQKIKNVSGSVIILHGDDDQVIDPAHGKTLFEEADEPKAFHSIPARGHNDLFDDIAPIVLPWLNDLDRIN